MDTIIVNYLHDTFTPEHVEYLSESIQILKTLDYLDFENVVLEYINSVDRIGIDLVNESIISSVDSTLVRALKLFGVVVNEDSNYTEKLQLIKELLLLEELGDPDIAINLLESEEDTLTALATLLEHAGGRPVEEYLLLIEDVRPGLIQRLKELYTQNENNQDTPNTDEEELRLIQDKRKRYIAFRNCFHGETGPLQPHLENNLPYLLPITMYLPIILNHEESSFEEKARSIVTATIICDSQQDSFGQVNSVMELLNPDPSIAVKLSQLCRQVIVTFQNHLNKGMQ